MAGVDFNTFGKLFGEDQLEFRPPSLPTVILRRLVPNIPTLISAKGPEHAAANVEERSAADEFPACDRVVKLRETFAGNPVAKIFASQVTLEYDLAEAGDGNALIVYDAWARCYSGKKPRSLSRAALEDEATTVSRARLLWKALCCGNPVHGKAEVAQELASMLEERDAMGELTVNGFAIPKYIKDALEYVLHIESK